VPYPSNDQKNSLTECFRCVLTKVWDAFRFLQFWRSGDPGWVRTVWLKRNHAPSRDNLPIVRLKITRSCALPSNNQNPSLTECFRRVLTMVLDGFHFLEFWGSGDPGWVRTVWLKRNHAPSRDNLRTVRLKIASSCALPFK
jgi:hypothetical protein